MRKAGRRLFGLSLFVVIGLFIALSITIFNKSFTDFTSITLETDRLGNQVPKSADVKSRGAIVGEVRSVSSDDDGHVKVNIGLYPGAADTLTTDTTARILPKTLFGERYIDLTDSSAGGRPLSSGDRITTDSSGNAREMQEVFDRLLPVLRAIPPADLNATLTALSQSLSGRGAALGVTIENLENVFGTMKDTLPELKGTLRGLSTFSKTYSSALPSMVNALDALRTTGNTVTERQNDLAGMFTTVGRAAVDVSGWLSANGRNFIDLQVDGEDFFKGFAQQSPSFGCTFGTLAHYTPEIDRIVGKGTKNPGAHVKVSFSNPRGRYIPYQDEPRFYHMNVPPRCYAQPKTGRPFPQYPGGGIGGDGSYAPPSRNGGQDVTLNDLPVPDVSPVPLSTVSQSLYGDPTMLSQLKFIYGNAAGDPTKEVPSWITLIGAPGLKGAEVHVR